MAPLPAPLDRFHWRQAWAAAKQHPVGSPRRTSCWLGRCLCTRVAFPVSHLSRSSSLIAGWCHRFVCPPLALILSIFLSHVSFSTPLGSAVLSGLDVCATKRTGTNARTNSRCIGRQCMPQGDGAKCIGVTIVTTLSNDKTIIVLRSRNCLFSVPYILNTFRNVTYIAIYRVNYIYELIRRDLIFYPCRKNVRIFPRSIERREDDRRERWVFGWTSSEKDNLANSNPASYAYNMLLHIRFDRRKNLNRKTECLKTGFYHPPSGAVQWKFPKIPLRNLWLRSCLYLDEDRQE